MRTSDLVAPLFVREGDRPSRSRSSSLPGVVQHTRESLRKEVAELAAARRSAPSCCSASRRVKDAIGSGASDPDGIVQLALADLRGDLGDDVVLIADLCVDEYTDHGHCGVLDEHGDVDNDATLEIYARAAVAQARAGAHVVAPSGMMDGQVGRDPRARSTTTGSRDVAILAYSAKYASGLYGPFRDAVDVHDRRRRRPQGLPAGLAQRPRGAARDRRRHRPGRRHGDGQAGARLPRRDPRGAPARRRADRRLPRQRRVRDDQGGGRQRVDRRRRRRPRAPHGDQARRRRRDPHLLRPVVRRGRRAAA